MVNKDFLKQVFVHEKKLLKLSEVKFKHVPLYDELSVVKLWPLMQEDKEFMQFMPSKLCKGRIPDRDYFFNVLNTINEEYVQRLVEHANSERNSAEAAKMESQVIEVAEDWLQQLRQVPFISSKCLRLFNCL